MAEGDNAGGNPDHGYGEIDLTWTDKIRKMVSSDAEWEAVILKKMEDKRNREMGIETEEPSSSFSVGGLLNRIKSFLPTRKGGADFSGSSQGPGRDTMPDMDGTRDQLMESQ